MSALLLCLVVAISDGDTLKVRCGDPSSPQQITVRLAEIDAPEKAQPHGQRSKRELSSLCYGQSAAVVPLKRDRYGRTVGRVECRGEDASLHQVSAGMAWAFTRYLTDPKIKKAEGEARSARAGLWADDGAAPPWEWRARLGSHRRGPEDGHVER